MTTVDGSIQITGTSNGTTQNNYGIYMQGGAVVQCTGTSTTATVQFDGTGANGTRRNYGIRLNQTSTTVSSAISNLTLNGNGGNGTTTQNRGIFIQNAAQVQSTGSGVNTATVTLTGIAGTGTNNCHGVRLNNAGTLVTSVDGDMIISATGNGTGNNGHGFDIRNGADIPSTGVGANAATITITGTTSGGTSGAGLFLNNGAVKAAGPNAITMTGTGQGVLAGLDTNNVLQISSEEDLIVETSPSVSIQPFWQMERSRERVISCFNLLHRLPRLDWEMHRLEHSIWTLLSWVLSQMDLIRSHLDVPMGLAQ